LADTGESDKDALGNAKPTEEDILDMVSLQTQTDELASQICKGDVVAVRCHMSNDPPYWLFQVDDTVMSAADTFTDEAGVVYPAGTLYFEGHWLERTSSKVERVYDYKRGADDFVMSHLVICRADVTPATTSSGRPTGALRASLDTHDSIMSHMGVKRTSEEVLQSSSEEGEDEEGEEEEVVTEEEDEEMLPLESP
jgi:hypothetical protein